MVVVENRKLEGVEVRVQLADLDSSCSGGLSEGAGSAGECSLIQHGLPPIVIGCITHACTQGSYTAPQHQNRLYISWRNGFWEGDWTIATVGFQWAMQSGYRFVVESMLESVLNNIYDRYIS